MTQRDEAADFASALEECDLVLKGGVTSGLVYPYALVEIAKRYRFRSIGGASVGSIAAGFAAAAEYARSKGDLAGYVRLQERCDRLPDILSSLFQPTPSLRLLFDVALAYLSPPRPKSPPLAPDQPPPEPPPPPTRRERVVAAVRALQPMMVAGAAWGAFGYLLAVLALAVLSAFLGQGFGTGVGAMLIGALPGLLLAAAGGALGLPAFRLWKLAISLPNHKFGLCSGLSQGDGPPALTDWMHDSLQYIAFGAAGRATPLTFGDLRGKGRAAPRIDLRFMTTNLSMERPEVIPRTPLKLLFEPGVWASLFPKPVMTYLADGFAGRTPVSRPHGRMPHLRTLPMGDNLPVVVGMRMSLCYPILIQAIPLHFEDNGPSARKELTKGEPRPIVPLWFADGGLTSNFPIHFFDALLPRRPTFAISLDDLPETSGQDLPRVTMPQKPDEGALSPVHKVEGVLGYGLAIVASGKNWQDQMQSVLPGQRQRVVRIRLKKHEGGLNLNMDPATSTLMMGFGREAGQMIRTDFKFEEHRWRRVAVAYQQLEVVATALREVWPTYANWYADYIRNVQSYDDRIPLEARIEIGVRMGKFSDGAAEIVPSPVKAKWPRPPGRLRTVPEL